MPNGETFDPTPIASQPRSMPPPPHHGSSQSAAEAAATDDDARLRAEARRAAIAREFAAVREQYIEERARQAQEEIDMARNDTHPLLRAQLCEVDEMQRERLWAAQHHFELQARDLHALCQQEHEFAQRDADLEKQDAQERLVAALRGKKQRLLDEKARIVLDPSGALDGRRAELAASLSLLSRDARCCTVFPLPAERMQPLSIHGLAAPALIGRPLSSTDIAEDVKRMESAIHAATQAAATEKEEAEAEQEQEETASKTEHNTEAKEEEATKAEAPQPL